MKGGRVGRGLDKEGGSIGKSGRVTGFVVTIAGTGRLGGWLGWDEQEGISAARGGFALRVRKCESWGKGMEIWHVFLFLLGEISLRLQWYSVLLALAC